MLSTTNLFYKEPNSMETTSLKSHEEGLYEPQYSVFNGISKDQYSTLLERTKTYLREEHKQNGQPRPLIKKNSSQNLQSSAFTSLLGKRQQNPETCVTSPLNPTTLPPPYFLQNPNNILHQSMLMNGVNPMQHYSNQLLNLHQQSHIPTPVTTGSLSQEQFLASNLLLNHKIFPSKMDDIARDNISATSKSDTEPSTQMKDLFGLAQPQKSLQDLNNEIMQAIPTIISHSKKCGSQTLDCQLNHLLLQYFIQNELQRKNSLSDSENGVKTVTSTNEVIDKEGSSNKSCHSSSNDCKEQKEENVFQSTQKSMLITKCPHKHRKHYAKNMCSSCYRKYGRNQNAWNCIHKDRLLYSMGMCQTCYLADYHKRKCQGLVKEEEHQDQQS